VGILAVGNCNTISEGNTAHNIHNSSRQIHAAAAQTRPDQSFCQSRGRASYSRDLAFRIRGGSVSKRSPTEINLSTKMAMASLFAGSVGGAIGVGASYPFDTLSTKAQVGAGTTLSNMARIWKNEGVGGFFEGVLSTMVGQAVIKAIQFAVNEISYLWLEKYSGIKSDVIKMVMGGILAGFVSSFVVSPVELVKIRMQSQNKLSTNTKDGDAATPSLVYSNSLECTRWIVKHEGWTKLFSHGLGMTMLRETPSYVFYFVAYGLLAKSGMASLLGRHAAPLLFGAIAGWAMWIPTYPIDIVKTLVQVQTRVKGSQKEMLNSRQITAKIYQAGGVRSFFDGLEPKLARAAVKHGVTFWVYEILMGFLRK